jgi:hypothetical protein
LKKAHSYTKELGPNASKKNIKKRLLKFLKKEELDDKPIFKEALLD